MSIATPTPLAPDSFRALVVRETPTGFQRAVERRPITDLPADGVLVRVRYSSLNFKDALSASGHRGVTKHYPHTPGIDAIGDDVIVTGFDLGMNTPGGFAEYVRVPADWLVARPTTLTPRQCAIYGTAGLCAAQCVWRIHQHGIAPGGTVVVTGATGGVGCLAVALLAHLGYRVVAVTGKTHLTGWLQNIGAAEVIARDYFLRAPLKPLLSARWDAGVDTVGGPILAVVIRQIRYRGVVAVCGNVGGAEFNSSVYPFILRGVTLAGIDTAQCPMELRRMLWGKLATEWRPACLDTLARECTLEEVSGELDRMLRGEQHGRVIVCLNG